MNLNLDPQTISSRLPETLQFYHLGEVTKSVLEPWVSKQANLNFPTSLGSERLQAAAFTLSGEKRALCLLFFPASEDFSTYSEFGNILSSKLVDHWSVLSAPQILGHERIEKLLGRLDRGEGNVIHREAYTHRLPFGREVKLEYWVCSNF